MAQGLWSSEINIAAKRKPLRLGEDIGQMRKYSTLDHYWGRRIKRYVLLDSFSPAVMTRAVYKHPVDEF
jgi:hypothetical protein